MRLYADLPSIRKRVYTDGVCQYVKIPVALEMPDPQKGSVRIRTKKKGKSSPGVKCGRDVRISWRDQRDRIEELRVKKAARLAPAIELQRQLKKARKAKRIAGESA